ncbi:MAG TPA: hypothetical protein ENG16_02605 [Archaeoglobus sp.]|nr:hypothetical protein [Archaeoglobus sp.]
MGAFYLYHKEANIQVDDVKHIFAQKGFSNPKIFDFGRWKLLLYRKVLLNVDNFYRENDQIICCVGTLVYKGLGYRDSLKRLLQDFRAKAVCQEELLGHFCVIYWDGENLTLLTDQLNTFHIFTNENRTVLSSSFLAVLVGMPYRLSLNRIALCEKLSTGYIISPDTLVEGIQKINDEIASQFSYEKDGLAFLPHPPRPPVDLHQGGREESLNRQIEVLRVHFQKFDRLNSEFHGELGLSDGYDSRLLLACSKFLSQKLSLHTHATKGVHDSTRQLVEKMAQTLGLELRVVRTTRLEEWPGERGDEILKDGLYFFDARCSYNMGALSEVYTRAYKTRVLGSKNRFSWNGLGGENL